MKNQNEKNWFTVVLKTSKMNSSNRIFVIVYIILKSIQLLKIIFSYFNKKTPKKILPGNHRPHFNDNLQKVVLARSHLKSLLSFTILSKSSNLFWIELISRYEKIMKMGMSQMFQCNINILHVVRTGARCMNKWDSTLLNSILSIMSYTFQIT